VSYGANLKDQFRRAGDYVDKIVRGMKPGEFPTANKVRIDHEPEDRQSARPRRASDVACPCRRTDRIGSNSVHAACSIRSRQQVALSYRIDLVNFSVRNVDEGDTAQRSPMIRRID